MADLSKVMEREGLHSEHAALCFLEAKRRERAQAKHAALVLGAFDRLQHEAKRDQLEEAAKVKRAARDRL